MTSNCSVRFGLVLCVPLLVLVPNAGATAAEVSIPFVTVKTADTSATLGIGFSPDGSQVSAIQFDLHYDTSKLTVSGAAGGAATAAGKSLATATLPDGTVRFIVSGLNQNALEIGSLVDLTVQLSPTTGDGTYALTLSNLIAVDASAATVSATSRDGAIRLATGPFATISANGFQGRVTLVPNSSFQILTGVDAGAGLTNPSDLYVGVSTPFGLRWLSSAGFTSQVRMLYRGAIPTFGPAVLLDFPSSVQLPAGTYTWFIIVVNGTNGFLADVVETVAP